VVGSMAGGFEEFRLFRPSCRLNSATSASKRAICSACPVTAELVRNRGP
jgi:hypothetical protein